MSSPAGKGAFMIGPVKKDLIVRGEQVYLRPITLEDTDRVVRWRNEKRVVENFIYRKPVTREDHLKWMVDKVGKGLVHQFIICRNADDMPLGSIYLQNIDEENKKGEWGIFLGEEAAYGKGIGTEAGKLIIRYSFRGLGLHKVYGRILAKNSASLRMAENTGCVREAYLRDELYLDGKYEDLVIIAMIDPYEHER